MKEQVNKAGVKKWFGNWLVDLQNEPLEAIQKYFSEFGAHIVQGCVITANGGNWNISAGIVAINDVTNGDGFKLVRTTAQTNVALPGYFVVTKTTQTGSYGTGTDDVSYTYAGTFTAGAAPGVSPDYLVIPAPASAAPVRFLDSLKALIKPVWSSSGLVFSTITINTWANVGAPYYNAGYRIDGDEVSLCGVVSNAIVPGSIPIITLPATACPTSDLKILAWVIKSGTGAVEQLTITASTGVISLSSAITGSCTVHFDGLTYRRA